MAAVVWTESQDHVWERSSRPWLKKDLTLMDVAKHYVVSITNKP